MYEFSASEYVDIKNQPYFRLILNAVEKSNESVIFLIGPWGSGKTSAINEFKKQQKNKFIFIERNYFGIRDVDDGIAHLIGIGWRFLLFIMILSILIVLHKITQSYLVLGSDVESSFLDAIELKGAVGVTLLFLFSFVIQPKSRLLFLFSLAFQNTFYYLRSLLTKKKTIIVIEDLDRSSLSLEDRFSFLSQLPPLSAQYLISFGHNNESEYLTLLEYINKLNGIIIEVQQDQEIAFSILQKNINYLPFIESAKWMTEISIRELLAVYYNLEREYSGRSDFEKKVELILKYFDFIRKTKIKYNSGRDSSDVQISFNGGKFKNDSSVSFTRYEGEILNSFYKSIDITYFRDSFEKSVPQKDKDSASNWIEVAWGNTVNDINYRKQIASKL